MPTVVIIHAAEDTLPARALAEKLRQAKLTVTIERPPGEELREAVRGAPVTVALWSPRAVAQPALIDEVAFAKGKSKVVHACMQSATSPEQFRNDQSVNLTGWRGEDDFAPWRDLAKLVTSKAGVPNLPPPAPKPPSGFFQPGVPDAAAQAAPQQGQRQGGRAQRQRAQPPRPQTAAARASNTTPPERKQGGGRGMLMGIIAFIIIAAAGGGGYWYFTQSQGAQATSLEDVDLNSASAIRAFLASDPSPAARERAEQALETLEQQSLDAARDANTIEAFEQFLSDFPESEEAVFVQGQIQQLRLLEAETDAAAPAEPPAGPPITELPADPDLVPPGTTPDPSGGGPAVITPPPVEPETEEPAGAPTE